MNDLLRFVSDKSPSHWPTNVFTSTSPAAMNFFAFERKGCSVEDAGVDGFVETVTDVGSYIITATGSNHVGRTSAITKFSVDSVIPDLGKEKKTKEPPSRRSTRKI